MATKSELRDQYIANGWTVQPVTDWLKVSDVDGVVKYDAQVVSPDNQFLTGQVMVTDDGGASEAAIALGSIKEKPTPTPTFSEAARTWLRTQEEGAPTIFALAVDKLYEHDEVLLATAYMTDNTSKQYVAKRRDGTFSFQETA